MRQSDTSKRIMRATGLSFELLTTEHGWTDPKNMMSTLFCDPAIQVQYNPSSPSTLLTPTKAGSILGNAITPGGHIHA
jgi:hypothetical protein